MIEIKGLGKTYTMGDNQVHALQGVDLQLEDGDFVAIMGPSGSGKSTLAHILGLLDVPSTGSYRLNGQEVSQLSADDLAVLRREEIGFIFQQFNLLPRITAAENVHLPLFYSRQAKGPDRSRELLTQVGLGERLDHKPNELSGGQQQRVAIARALVNRPRMILADEPTGNLDSQSEKDIMQILRDLNAQGITIVMVTHEEEVGQQAKRLIRMRDGKVQSDTRNRPLNPSTEKKSTANPPLELSWWKESLEHFDQGFRVLAANKVRTALSVLGILIGVAAVVAMLALGNGAQKAIESQLSSLGSNMLTLRSGAKRVGGVAQEAGSITRLSAEDATVIKNNFDDIKAVAASVNGRAQVTFANKNWSTQILGTATDYAGMRASQPEVGRFFSEEEDRKRARVAVLGATVVRELFGEQNPIGEMVKVNKISFQVIGVLPTKGSSGWRDQDDLIIVPLFTAMYRLLGKDFVDSIDIEVKNAEATSSLETGVVDFMNRRYHIPEYQQEESFQVRNMADIQAALSSSSQTMSMLLAAIAAISLLVGGIGIMNIMLVSVTERTKEIGLRKAIGARRRDILMQFLAESVAVSVLGGVAGVALGWLITTILSLAIGWTTEVSLQSVFLSVFFSAFVGIVFGMYPAKKASELNPIDALRYE